MTKPALFKFTSAVILLFAFSTIPAFAQRGGGGHGGGGFHGGGGGMSSAPRMGGTYSRAVPSAPQRYAGGSYGSYARPGGSSYRSYSSPVNGNQRAAVSSAAPRGIADGQWHSFGGGTENRGAVTSQAEARASSSTGGGWQVFGGNRTAGSGVTRSFSGQGHDVWENTQVGRNVAPSSAALSATSRFASGSAFGSRAGGVVPFRNAAGFGLPFRGGFSRGCWGCGFGFGFGWWPGWGFGFGWPWVSDWGWNPYYWDSLWLGWPGYDYYGYGYPAAYPYPYDPSADGYSYSAPPDSYPGTDPGMQSSAQVSQQTSSVANAAVPILLYLTDGSVYSTRDYWLSGGQLHYVLLNGREGAFDLDQLDVRRTADENAKSGTQFTLKPGPAGSVPMPDTNGTPPITTPPAATPSPAPQINLTSQPRMES